MMSISTVAASAGQAEEIQAAVSLDFVLGPEELCRPRERAFLMSDLHGS